MAIIASDRKVTWEGHVGISGGIPVRSTIFTTIPAGASTSTIQTAIDNCPSGQVILLSSGSYTLTASLDWQGCNNNITLRGAGPTLTTINMGTNHLMMRQIVSESALSVDANLSANATKDGTTLTLTSVPSWVTVGGLIGLDQLDDSSFVAGAGTEGGQSYREILGNGARGLAQLNRVTAKTSTTITLETPLYYGFTTAKTAQIFQPFFDPSTQVALVGCSVEDLKLTSNTTQTDTHGIKIEIGDSCWFKNLEIANIAGGAGIFTTACYRLEIRHCYLHDSHSQAAGQGYGVALYHFSSACLIEDNIFRVLHNAQTINYGSSGNVFAYNYEADGTSGSNQNPGMNTHGVHCYMNLFEGNYCEDKVLADWTHGSSSHNTVFRCRVTGENGNANTDSFCAVSVEYYNRFWNIVGNILGKTGQQNKYLQDSSSQSEGSNGSILKVGGEVNINSDFSPSDADSYTTGSFILIHGNYDTLTTSIHYDSNIADHTLVNSYAYSSKPSFFASLAWPPFDPASPGSASVESIPSGYRFVHGIDPGGPSTFLSDGTPGNIQALHDSSECHDGDTITIPSGTFSWTTGVSITKRITLQGNTTVTGNHTSQNGAHQSTMSANDLSIIQDDLVVRNTGATLIKFTVSPGVETSRITGLTFAAGAVSTTLPSDGAIRFISTGVTPYGRFRIDQCHFNQPRWGHSFFVKGWSYGVMDHCINNSRPGVSAIFALIWTDLYLAPGMLSTANGHGSFADFPYFGTEKFFFFEDNSFIGPGTSGGAGTGNFDSKDGARFVMRYNIWNNSKPNSHGTEAGPQRGVRAVQQYGETFYYNPGLTWNGGEFRSGTFISHDNAVYGQLPTGNKFPYYLQAQRAVGGQAGPNFPPAAGQSAWDQNADTDGTTPVPAGDSGHLFYSSAAVSLTGSAGTYTVTVTDSMGATNYAGYGIYNSTLLQTGQHRSGIIVSNTSTTITYNTYDGADHPQLIFNPGDIVQIYKPLQIMDQPGTGKGDVCTSTSSTQTNVTLGKEAWPRNQQERIFTWNNVYNGTTDMVVTNGGYPTIVDNTHFKNKGSGLTAFTIPSDVQTYYDASKNGVAYASEYVYPHPLTGGALGKIILLSGNLDYGNVIIGETPTRTVHVSNQGDSDLTVDSVAYDNVKFTGSTAGFTVIPGATHDIVVTYTPTTETLDTCTITFDSDADSGTETILATGSGVPPAGGGGQGRGKGHKKGVLIRRF